MGLETNVYFIPPAPNFHNLIYYTDIYILLQLPNKQNLDYQGIVFPELSSSYWFFKIY